MLSTRVTTRLTLDGSASYRRSPFFHLVPAAAGSLPVPGVMVPSEGFAARRLDHDTSEGTVGFTSPYTRRSTLSAAISARATRFFTDPGSDFELWGARGTWTRKMTRDVALRLGYGREEIRQTAMAEGRFVHEVIDAGIDLAREFSLARRTGLTVTTQTSMVRESGGERRYRLNGGLDITRGFRRTWTAGAAVTRNTEFLPGFLEPVFSDGVSASLSGMLADRLEWTGAIGASRGRAGFEAVDDFISYTGTTRLSAGLTRHLGWYAEYTYYRYDLPPGSSTVIQLPHLSRQAVSVGVTAFVPIYTRVRARDPR